jgi:hypothetical protein
MYVPLDEKSIAVALGSMPGLAGSGLVWVSGRFVISAADPAVCARAHPKMRP